MAKLLPVDFTKHVVFMIRIFQSANEFETDCVNEHNLVPCVIYTAVAEMGLRVKFSLPIIVVNLADGF